MTTEQAVADLDKLRALARQDPREAHVKADQILIRFLLAANYKELAQAWIGIRPKYYGKT